MKTKKALLSIRIIFWITNFLLGIISFVLLLSIIYNILYYSNFLDNNNNIHFHTNLPLKVDFTEVGNLQINNKNIKVKLDSSSANFFFIDYSDFVTKYTGFLLLIIGLGTGYITWIFRAFIKNVKEGKIFNTKNISILKTLAYSVAGYWLFMIVFMQIFHYYVVKNLKFENIRLTNDVLTNWGILFIALFIWVLAQIFITGLKLQEEKDLTI